MWIKDIDEKDNQIINLLLENGRLSYSEIGNKIGLTRTAVKNRITNLERNGFIEGYRAVVTPHKNSEMITFVINIETTADNLEEIKKLFNDSKETLTVLQTTGNCHLLAICATSDLTAMQKFVRNVYSHWQGVLSINAHVILDIVKGTIIPDK